MAAFDERSVPPPSLFDIARVCDALAAAGRRDLAGCIIQFLYDQAERELPALAVRHFSPALCRKLTLSGHVNDNRNTNQVSG
jgi:hypothetical protein